MQKQASPPHASPIYHFLFFDRVSAHPIMILKCDCGSTHFTTMRHGIGDIISMTAADAQYQIPEFLNNEAVFTRPSKKIGSKC